MAAKKKKKKGSKKKGGKRKGTKKKVYRKAARKKNLAVMVGSAKTVYDTEMAADAWGSTVLKAQKNAAIAVLKGDFSNPWIKHAAQVTYSQALNNSGPALVGAAISYGEDIPIIGGLVREVKRPMNRALNKFEKRVLKKKRGRWKW